MFARVSIASVLATVFGLGLVAPAPAAPPAAVQEKAPGPARALEAPKVAPPATAPQPAKVLEPAAIKLEQLTKGQFEALPATQVIEFRGKRSTKADFLARMEQERKEALANFKAAASRANSNFEARRAQFLQEQKAKIDALNAAVRAAFAAHQTQRGGLARSAAHEAIRQEASQLLERSKTASPAEQAQIEQRAGELLKQLQQVPR